MGKVDEFILKELPQIKEKEKKEKETENYYSKLAWEFLAALESYKKILGVNPESAQWYEFFKNYLKRISSSPRVVSYLDDFVLKQLSSLFEKCPKGEYFIEGVGAYFFWTMLYLPALFFLSLSYLSHNSQDVFLKVAAVGGVFIPLLSRKGRKMILSYVFILVALGFFPEFFVNLPLAWKLAFITLYSFLVLFYWARVYAIAKCAEFAFPVSFITVQELVNRLAKEVSQ